MDTLDRKPRGTLIVLGAVFSLAFLSLIGWLVYIQVHGQDILRRLAQRQQAVRTRVCSYRGAVVDARGRAMAATVEAYSVFADPKLIYEERYDQWRIGPRGAGGSRSTGAAAVASADTSAGGAFSPLFDTCSPAARQLATALAIDPGDIERLIEANAQRHFVWLKRRVDLNTARAVRALKLPGVGIRPENKRHYPHGQLAAHVLGAVGSESQGLDGLEFALDSQLSGTDGHRIARVDGKRRPVWIRPRDYKPSADGHLMVLTIDLTIQMLVEETLRDAVEQYKARGGVAIVMDPQTGDVLALANYPTFDPDRFAEADDYARRNRALTDPYEPGSTMKCFIAAAALETGVARAGERIFCHNGVHYIRGRRLTDEHGYGWLTFEETVIKSSNIGMATVGDRMGNERLHEALCRFGFGSRTGVGLPGEGTGLVYPLSRWSAWSATSIPIGYEVLVTPIQLVTAFSAIANGGLLMRPRLVRHAYSGEGELVDDLSRPVVVRRALKQETADFMRGQVLRRVVTEGTGKRAAVPGYRVFGKTGTAIKRDPGGGYSATLRVGSFIAGAPLENPRVVAMVVLDEPERSLGYFGGTVAAPAVARILENTLRYLRVPLDEPMQVARGSGVAAN